VKDVITEFSLAARTKVVVSKNTIQLSSKVGEGMRDDFRAVVALSKFREQFLEFQQDRSG
jgi:hypothetical protein